MAMHISTRESMQRSMLGDFDVDTGRLGWLIGGGILALVLLFVIHSFVGTFVFGLFIYYASRPVYDWIRRRTDLPSGIVATISLFALALPALCLFLYTLAVGLQEANQLATRNDLSEFQQTLGPYINASTGVKNPGQILENPESFLSRPGIQESLGQLVTPLLDSVGFLGNTLIHLFIMIVLAYYLLKDGRRLSWWFRHRFADERDVLDQFFRMVDRDFRNIFFGNILNAFLTAVIGALAYSALNVVAPPGISIPYAVLVGLLTGLGSLVPVVGMKLVYVPVGLYLGGSTYLAEGAAALWFPVLFFVVSFAIVDVIPDLVLRPYVSGRDLHLGAMMLAYTFGPLVWGWYGIFLGPMVLVLIVHFAMIVLPELIQSRSLAPYSVDPTYLDEVTTDEGVTATATDGQLSPESADPESRDSDSG